MAGQCRRAILKRRLPAHLPVGDCRTDIRRVPSLASSRPGGSLRLISRDSEVAMPPTIRAAAGPDKPFSPRLTPVPPSNVPADEAHNPRVRSPETQERLLAEVAGALQANLAR